MRAVRPAEDPGSGVHRPRILLTEGSSLSARQTLYCLGSRYVTDLVDPRPRFCLARFSRFVRRSYSCPSFASEPVAYLRRLGDLLGRHEYDVLLPTHEQAYLLSRFRSAVSRRVGLALPEFSALEQLQDKAQFLRLLETLGLPFPATEFVRSTRELQREWDYPVFVKLAHSTAGCGVHFVEGPARLQQVAQLLERQGHFDGAGEVLVQQPARGVQATVQAVFQQGRLVGAHCFTARHVGVGGMSSARVSASHPIVLEQAERLGSYLDWHGAFFLDYFYDPQTGLPEYIEANPRIGETVNAFLSGNNLCETLVRVSLGEPVDAPQVSRSGVRSHSLLMIVMYVAEQGGSRTDIVRELRKARRGQDRYRDSQDELTRPRDDPLSLVPAMAVISRLLACPRSARRLIRRTVENYSMPDSAAQAIRRLPAEAVASAFPPSPATGEHPSEDQPVAGT